MSLGVWAHHMFTVGMTSCGNAFFLLSTMLVASPPASKSSTGWPQCRAARSFAPPMLFCFAFLPVPDRRPDGHHAGHCPVRLSTHNTYFVVAHFHWVLIGGICSGIFAGIYYWYPKVTGRMLRAAGQWHFWLFIHRLHVDVRG